MVVSVLGLNSIFYLYSFGYVIAAIMVGSIITFNKKKHFNDKLDASSVSIITDKGKYRELLANKKFTLLIISAFFVSGTNVANNTYFGFLYIAGGGALIGIGIVFLLMVGSEAAFMAWSDKLANKFTLEKTILVSMIISVFRYFLYSSIPSNEVLIFTFFLQGMVNGIVLVEFVRYISKLVETRLLGMAVSVYYCISCNVSTIICQLLGGIILDKYDVGAVYLFFALYNFTGVALYLLWGLHRPEKNLVDV
jgi:PPP family 3-phenylpropionic acid transporter